MRQGNAVRLAAGQADAELPADDLPEGGGLEETSYREPSDGDDKRRAKELELPFEPAPARVDLLGGGDPVAAPRELPRKAAAHGCKIHPFADLLLAPSERPMEPFEKRPAGGPCEGPPEEGLPVARRLADEHDRARHEAADNNRLVHPRAEVAPAQGSQVSLNGLCRHRKKKDGGPRGRSILCKFSL